MATDTAGRFSPHMRGVTVTALASVMGILAAVGSSVVTAEAATPATDPMGVFVLAGAILVQFPVLQVVGIDVGEFSTKDYLYVAFMTFSLWFVCWGILLSTGTTF
ncbi:hypothetical protein [Halosegnis marinus]|uniref:Uncharacterized protein n=1 Tax=Halosegnis marinus TaxID=3034023 RepID=A0ABD5ZN72_9EURY|nr:hypothetical protein [Halosegnis sp. DT85]